MGDRLSEQYTTAGFERDRPPPQRVLNESWPAPEVARKLRDVESYRQIPVSARIVFEKDGPQWLEGTATRWTRIHGCVMLADQRLIVPYVWLNATDIRRRPQPRS